MKILHAFALLLCLLWNVQIGKAQTARDYAVELKVKVDALKPAIQLYWPLDTTATQYGIYRKLPDDLQWQFLATVPKTSSFFDDTIVQVSVVYEYQVLKTKPGINAAAYAYAGIHIKQEEYKGKILLLIDSNMINPLHSEISRYAEDLRQEGWQPIQLSVNRNDDVKTIKQRVYSVYQADSVNLKNVVLIGRAPVPYSGNFNPDAHPEHKGAWPADLYYVTFDLNFTDVSVNTSSAQRSENRNVPNDGKFDQDYIWPYLAKIPIGRIDLSNMPTFGNDTQLLKQYLDKNHLYRNGHLKAENRGLISDNFGVFGGEAFAANAWRSFGLLFGDSIQTGSYRTTLQNQTYAMSYACGAGTYTSANGVSTSANFVTDSLLNPFTFLFGSYFGDWDNENNFLRAPLASKGWGLASAWAGRPFWMLHPLAIGQSIGRAALLAQNSYPLYQAGFSGTFCHIALMGDSSLRLFIKQAPQDFKAQTFCDINRVQLSWGLPNYNCDSLFVYRFSPNTDSYVRIASLSGADTVYTDFLATAGLNTYLIKALIKEEAYSGSWYNLSVAAKTSIWYKPKANVLLPDFERDTLFACNELTLESQNAGSYNKFGWNTGDSIAQIIISKSGNYSILMEKDSSFCSLSEVFVKIIKERLPDNIDTTICSLALNDSIHFGLVSLLGSEYSFFDSTQKNQIEQITFVTQPHESRKQHYPFYVADVNDSVKCQVNFVADLGFNYPNLIEKDTLSQKNTLVSVAVNDSYFTSIDWSTGDTGLNVNIENSGFYVVEATDDAACVQSDSFHFSRLDLKILPSQTNPQRGQPVGYYVSDSSNQNSIVIWNNGTQGWNSTYAFSKAIDSVIATQHDDYFSVTDTIVVQTLPGTYAQKTDQFSQSVVFMPNPFENRVCCRFSNKSMRKLVLIDPLGKELQRTEGDAKEYCFENLILAPGMYYVCLEDGPLKRCFDVIRK